MGMLVTLPNAQPTTKACQGHGGVWLLLQSSISGCYFWVPLLGMGGQHKKPWTRLGKAPASIPEGFGSPPPSPKRSLHPAARPASRMGESPP